MRKCAPILVWSAIVAASAHAQSAILTISHDDPDGLVAPGQVVRFDVSIVSIGTAQFWEVRGDVRASPNLGIATSPAFGTFPAPGGPNAIVHVGTPTGGSVLGVHIYSGDLSIQWLGVQAPWYYNPLRFLQFDWTAPATPGVVEWAWQPSPALPEPLYLVAPFPFWPPVPVPTTYVSTSLIVIPAPGGILLIGMGLASSVGRRRRRAPAR